jgi:hypothetical protein
VRTRRLALALVLAAPLVFAAYRSGELLVGAILLGTLAAAATLTVAGVLVGVALVRLGYGLYVRVRG